MYNITKQVNKLARLKTTGEICLVTSQTDFTLDKSMIFYTILLKGNILKVYEKTLTIIK